MLKITKGELTHRNSSAEFNISYFMKVLKIIRYSMRKMVSLNGKFLTMLRSKVRKFSICCFMLFETTALQLPLKIIKEKITNNKLKHNININWQRSLAKCKSQILLKFCQFIDFIGCYSRAFSVAASELQL